MPNHRYKGTQHIDELPTRASHAKRIMVIEELLRSIALQGCSFTTVTLLTHERFLLSFDGLAKNSRDVFWLEPAV